ncbi:MAG: HD domain-containing protein [Patescibacteria group bacterium]|jgi:HD superfamily phosphohydrolase|nr:HD domain-containing protein [Patescibacteria group bacterium]
MKKLIIQDKIYGRFIITEPVIIDLLKSTAILRLKEVSQLGPHDLHYSSPGYLNRYDHSVGVMLLLRQYGAELNEQIAGLLHDISHTAFSHVSDYIFNSHAAQDYQDSKLEKAFEIQGINKILKEHGINPKIILDHHRWPLLEKDLPDLCADRIDYTLRDPSLGRVTNAKPRELLANLKTNSGQWFFTNRVWAKKFAVAYLKIAQLVWCNPTQSALFEIMAQAIKEGLAKNIITKKDLFTTDKNLLRLLKQSKNKEIANRLQLLRVLKTKEVPKAQADFYTKSKPRAVDPYFQNRNGLIRLTKVDKPYQQRMNVWVAKAKKGFYIKIIN